jgi:hypothetical protein
MNTTKHDPREHVSGADALHPDCPHGGTEGAPCSAARPTTVKAAGPFGGNSQSGRTAQHGTQSGYVMHRRAAQAEHDAAGPAHADWCAGPSTHITECQLCKDAHAAYANRSGPPRYTATERAIQAEMQATAAYAGRPVPVRLDGCTCRAIAGSHAASCQWAM